MMDSKKVRRRRYTASFPAFQRGRLIAAYFCVRLTPQALRALPANILRIHPGFGFLSAPILIGLKKGRGHESND
jgi:hypothetical protein